MSGDTFYHEWAELIQEEMGKTQQHAEASPFYMHAASLGLSVPHCDQSRLCPHHQWIWCDPLSLLTVADQSPPRFSRQSTELRARLWLWQLAQSVLHTFHRCSNWLVMHFSPHEVKVCVEAYLATHTENISVSYRYMELYLHRHIYAHAQSSQQFIGNRFPKGVMRIENSIT